jgi:DHA2 family methylenomycin A resistance protein-like MFS transporter
MHDPASPTTDQALQPRQPTRPGRVLTVMCVSMFLVLLDVTVVNVALPSIASGLGADAGEVQWVVDAYAVGIASLLLAGGTIGDRVGHRRVVLIGLVLFGAASAACGLAAGVGVLIAARAAQGIGAALLLPGSLALIIQAHPDRARQARALGIWAGISSLALPAGPVLGGLLITAGGWHAVFLVNVPIVAASLVIVALLIVPGGRRADRPTDPLGIVLAAVTLGTLVFAVIDVGHHGLHPSGVGALLVALCSVIGFAVHEWHSAAPMLPLDLVRHPAFAGPNLAACAMNLVFNGFLFVTTLYLQIVQHRDAMTAGGALLPLFVPLAALAPIAGRLTARFGARPPLVAGASIAALGAAGYALLTPTSSYLTLLPVLLALGVGAGLFTTPVVAAAVAAVPTERSGLATGINNTARQTGTALGIAIFGAVASATAAPSEFVVGLHTLAVIGSLIWLAVLALVAVTTSGNTCSASPRAGVRTSPR